jgi:hypothetical protein
MRNLKGSYEGISEFYFEVKVTSPTAEGNMSKLEVEMVYFNSDESFCWNIYVHLRCESIVQTPDPS